MSTLIKIVEVLALLFAILVLIVLNMAVLKTIFEDKSKRTKK